MTEQELITRLRAEVTRWETVAAEEGEAAARHTTTNPVMAARLEGWRAGRTVSAKALHRILEGYRDTRGHHPGAGPESTHPATAQ